MLALHACRAGKPLEGAALVKAMQELDQDNSGEIDFEEFSLWWPKYCARLTSTRNRSGFDGVLGSAVDEVASQQSEERVQFDEQLLKVVKFMEGKSAAELKVEYEALVRWDQTCLIVPSPKSKFTHCRFKKMTCS